MMRINLGDRIDKIFANMNNMSHVEAGAVIEYVEGMGLTIVVFLHRMTASERQTIANDKVSIKIMSDNNFVLTMLRFGDSDLLFEILFDPNRLNITDNPNFLKSNLITLYGVDSATGEIRAMRSGNIPMKLYDILKNSWIKALNNPLYSQTYPMWVADLDRHYDLYRLWEYATYIGRIGDS